VQCATELGARYALFSGLTAKIPDRTVTDYGGSRGLADELAFSKTIGKEEE
jgi:hypothetical protein